MNRLLAATEYLLSLENLKGLEKILFKDIYTLKDSKGSHFSKRVRTQKEADQIFLRVVEEVHDFLGIAHQGFRKPKLVLTKRLSRLPKRLLPLYVFPSICALIQARLLTASTHLSIEDYFVTACIISLFLVPLLIYRRSKLNVEHACLYIRKPDNRGEIVIDQLKEADFAASLAHEYAHHIYYELNMPGSPVLKEGWARGIQRIIGERYAQRENDKSHLRGVLDITVGELKYAYMWMCCRLKHKIPRWLRRTRTIYDGNPFSRWITGKPGFSRNQLEIHAFGTALFRLAEERFGQGIYREFIKGGLRGEEEIVNALSYSR